MEKQYNELVDWIRQKNKKNKPISEEMDLVEEDILDSLLFAEYVMMIEDLSGIEIEVGDELLDKIRTLALVKNNYFNAAYNKEN